MSELEPLEYGVFWGASLFARMGNKYPLIDNILYQGDTIFISAQTGVGKSVLVMQMMAALTTGGRFLDAFKVSRPCNVLYLQTEGDRAETYDRIKSMGKGVDFDHSRWVHVNLDGVALNTDEGFARFVELAGRPAIKYDVIIIDPLYTTIKGSMNSDEVANAWIISLRKIRDMYKCSYIVTHHDTIKEYHAQDGSKVEKSNKDLMGSSVWGFFVNYNYKLSVDKKTGIFTFASGKERNKMIIDSLTMRMIEPEPLMFAIADDTYSLSENQVLRIVYDSKVDLFPREIVRQTGLSRATVYRCFAKLLEAKKIAKHGEGSTAKYGKILEKSLDRAVEV